MKNLEQNNPRNRKTYFA